MSAPTTPEPALASTADARPQHSTLERATLARRAAAGALALGILADMLLRDGPIGIGIALWMLVFAGTTTVLVWRRGELTREPAAWLGVALLFASAIAWRDAGDLQFFDFATTLAILLVLGVTLRQPDTIRVFRARLRDLVWGAVGGVGDACIGLVTLLYKDAALPEAFPSARRNSAARWLRAVVITVPLIVLFGTLFRSADPLFDRLVALPSLDLGTLLSHVVIAGFFTWIVGGWLRGSIVSDARRASVPEGFPITLTTVELTILLGALDLLFAAFVAVQIGWFFGGEALVRATTGLTLAEYARRGFFELVWVTVLVLPVLLGCSAALARDDAAAATRFRRLSLPLLALLAAVMVSALGRMALYVRNYGLSTDRIDATAFMLWLAIVFVLFALTVLRGRPARFAGGMIVSGLGVLAALNLASPDAIATRVNVQRAVSRATSQPLDFAYLATRSGDAVPIVVRALLTTPALPPGTAAFESERRMRCEAAYSLLVRWSRDPRYHSGTRPRAWTTWNYGRATGERAVNANQAALQRIACDPRNAR